MQNIVNHILCFVFNCLILNLDLLFHRQTLKYLNGLSCLAPSLAPSSSSSPPLLFSEHKICQTAVLNERRSRRHFAHTHTHVVSDKVTICVLKQDVNWLIRRRNSKLKEGECDIPFEHRWRCCFLV